MALTHETPPHGAAPSALGYLFQTDWGLLELLRRGPDVPDSTMSLEMHDDVAWDTDGTATELLQLKHHLNVSASIADKGTDVWRSVRVWLDQSPAGDPHGPTLALITTATAAGDSGLYCLRPQSRDVAAALSLLEAAARTSTSGATEEARKRFLAMDAIDREAFLSRMYVLDGVPHVSDLDAEVRRVLVWGLPRGHEDLFMQMLWGWWRREALLMLQGRRSPIGVGEVQDQVAEIRDQFTRDRLPTLVHLADVDPAEMAELLRDRTFVDQLRLIDWPEHNLQRALIDYYRAYVHTTKWVDEDLIGLPELLNFGLELIDEWSSEFEFMKSELDADAHDDEMKEAGVKLLRKLLESNSIQVRPRYDEPFFARGKRHELSDERQIGWHPEFEAALDAMVVAP